MRQQCRVDGKRHSKCIEWAETAQVATCDTSVAVAPDASVTALLHSDSRFLFHVKLSNFVDWTEWSEVRN